MRRQKKYNIILFLIILLLGLGLGYAALSANLEIDGTTNLTKTTWDIHFANIHETSGGVTPNSTTSINAAGDTVTYSITLSTPGDFYEFTVDAVNAGTVDGMIESVSSTLNGGSISNLPDCLSYSATYSDGITIDANHILAASSSVTYKIRVEFKTDIDEDDLPDSNQTLSFAFGINYIQKTSSGIPRPTPQQVFTISSTTNYIGQALPNVTTYNTYQEAVTAFGYDFFLRHSIVNNIVTESYVGFVKGGTAYYLRGGVDEHEAATKPVYEANKATLLSAFGSGNCSTDISCGDNCIYTNCSASGLSADAYSDGGVTARGVDWYCYVLVDGSSYCGGDDIG